MDIPILRSKKLRRLAASLALGSVAVTGAIAARPSGPPIDRDIVYATRGGQELTLDVYQPGGEGPHPVIVLVHGGSWKGGDKSDWEALAPRIADAGFVAFSVNYRLTEGPGEIEHPAPVRDLEAALTWVRDHAAAYDGDATQLAMIGSSAGAHLVLLVAARERVALPDALAVLSPPANMRVLARGSLASPVRDYLGCEPETCPGRYRHSSPVHRITSSMPPVFLAYSTDELIPQPQEDALARALSDHGVLTQVTVFPGTRHALTIGADVLDRALKFLTAHLD